MEAPCTSKTLAVLPASTYCKDLRAESTSTMNYNELLTSIENRFLIDLSAPQHEVFAIPTFRILIQGFYEYSNYYFLPCDSS
jgi:hypothetical protein